MEGLMENLEKLKLRPDADLTMTSLDAILETLDDEAVDRDTSVVGLVEGGILKELHHQLSSAGGSGEEKTAQVIAELAKTEEARGPCVTENLIPGLLDLVSGDDSAACIQACRALGNICFDNDAARQCIDGRSGVAILLTLLRKNLDSTGPEAAKLRKVACGFLLNLTNNHAGIKMASCNVQRPYSLYKLEPNSPTESESVRMITLRINLDSNANQETVQEKMLAQGGLEILNNYLAKHSDDESVVQMALLSVGCLAESDLGREKLREVPVAVTVAELLGTETGADRQDNILELLSNLAEYDEVKVQLAKSSLCDRILDLLEAARGRQGGTEDDPQLEKMASDLVILLLTGDGSMEILYDEGRGRVYQECLKWLQSSSGYLRMTAALAVGNFARNDAQCIKLVEADITERLLSLLEGSTGEAAAPDSTFSTLQHAVFSALRNLAIPATNKPAMLQCGLVRRLLQHIDTEFSVVQFKLLGTMRMAIDGQESAAIELGTSDAFLTRLMTWCKVEDHAGVKGEATRLVAWLIKHSRAQPVMSAVLDHGGLTHLVAMVNSEHAVMQNEALVALSLLATVLIESHTEEFKNAELVPGLKVLLTDGATVPEVAANALTLCKMLCKSDPLKKLMVSAEIRAVARKLQGSDEAKVSQPAKELAAILGKG